MATDLPVIDLEPVLAGAPIEPVARAIDDACRSFGFFTVVGHGIPPQRLDDLETAARSFFAQPSREKEAIAMGHGGRAWRGWFAPGGELTAGVADRKEGVYFGTDLPDDHPRVLAGTPLHGANLWPTRPATLRPAVEAWMAAVEDLGHRLLEVMAVGLDLEPDWFSRHLTADPTLLFRIFRYPAEPGPVDAWGVGEHTDYGLLTILAQDGHPGLQVRTPTGWVDVPADRHALVCNLGDMLDRMTGGRYRSTPHRVLPAADTDRLSFPFFLDPSWGAQVRPLPLRGDPPADDAASRWDGTSLQTLSGTYGDYLGAKVAKVFPALVASRLRSEGQ